MSSLVKQLCFFVMQQSIVVVVVVPCLAWLRMVTLAWERKMDKMMLLLVVLVVIVEGPIFRGIAVKIRQNVFLS